MMARDILPLIPQHSLYTEAYFGGGAIFWAKEPSKIEVINDLNGEVVNFYVVLQTDYQALNKLIKTTLHSRKQHKAAYFIYQNPDMFDPIRRAWAFWLLCSEGFSTKIGSWGYDKTSNSIAKKVNNQKAAFHAEAFKERIEHVQIECNDGVKVIESRDSANAFHYIDTPYFNSNCGHYDGYTEQHFRTQLDSCEKLQGKFLLSSYPSDALTEYVDRNGWHQLTFQKKIAVNHRVKKFKVEVLTANYPLPTNPKPLNDL